MFDLVENRLSYAIIFGSSYLYYLSHIISSITTDISFYFPNQILFLFISISGFLLAMAMQELDHVDVRWTKFIFLLVLGLVPTLVVIHYIYKQVKYEKRRNNDPLFILGLRIIMITLILLSALFLIVVLLIIILESNYIILYVIMYSSLGLLGYNLGYILTKITNDTGLINRIYGFFNPIIATRKRRIGIGMTILVLTITLIIMDLITSFQPITN